MSKKHKRKDEETVCVPSPFDAPPPAHHRSGSEQGPFPAFPDASAPYFSASASSSSSQPHGFRRSSTGVDYGGTSYGAPQGGYGAFGDPSNPFGGSFSGPFGGGYGGGGGGRGGGSSSSFSGGPGGWDGSGGAFVGSGGGGGFGEPNPFGHHCYAPSAPQMKVEDDDFPLYFAEAPARGGLRGGPSSSAPVPKQRSRSESSVGASVVNIRACPVCKSISDDPLMTLVIRCRVCDLKYCCFCMSKLQDGLPCGRKPCRKKTKAMWKEEDKEFAEYNVQPLKLKGSTKVKRRIQNVGYGVGVGACGVASATMVAAGVAGVPFTAGLSLALIPMAAAPVAGGKMALDRRKRWIAQCKDKRRQSVRSQILQTQDFDFANQGGEDHSPFPSPSPSPSSPSPSPSPFPSPSPSPSSSPSPSPSLDVSSPAASSGSSSPSSFHLQFSEEPPSYQPS